MVLMKNKNYKYAPIVILLSGWVFFGLITFFIDRQNSLNQFPAWVLFAIFQMIISIIYGIQIKELNRQVHIDMLTGLYNRKYFNEKLSGLISKGLISLLLIDIDNFKCINDTFGHMAGDKVLQQFAEILRFCTRKNDLVARWGGEEFTVILFQTEPEETLIIADRIRLIVNNRYFSYEGSTFKISVSIGVASIKKDSIIGKDQIIKIADQALYKAKQKKNDIAVLTN
ncbi:MAG TPA: GGDEF domain-containing protein [Desulfotomaculum sp.]|nr:GGDEF domain-containing protein [Desulfotomaculum sp.]HBY04472.1 GGDEF domain-containing protein [Desulfotomaculum sp.]